MNRAKAARRSSIKSEGGLVATRLGKSDADVLMLRSADRAAYLRAMELLGADIPLEVAVAEFVSAKKALGEVPIMHAVEFYQSRFPKGRKLVPVQRVIDELLKEREADRVSKGYLNHPPSAPFQAVG